MMYMYVCVYIFLASLTILLLHHLRDERLAAQGGAQQVRIQDLADVVDRGPVQERVLRDAGGVDEDVYPLLLFVGGRCVCVSVSF